MLQLVDPGNRNGTMNVISIMSGLWTVSNVLRDEKYKAIATTVSEEIVALAEALGYTMPPTLARTTLETSENLAEGYKASMVVDLEEGRPLEMEVILINPIEIAKRNNFIHVIPTWYQLCKDLIKYVEDRKASL